MDASSGYSGMTNSYEAQKGDFSAPQAAPAEYDASSNRADVSAERLVIQNANLTIVVGEPGQAMTAIRRMAEEMGGFVVASNLYKAYRGDAGELPEATITVRVPAARLNEALDQVKTLTENPNQDVKSETISGQDVTKEYTDLRSRLKNLEETEAQLREIMGSATKTEDVLAVYRELTNIREQIEVIKGQIQYFEEAAAMSSIAVLVQAKASIQPLEIGGWQPAGVARESIQALIKAMQGLADLGIRLILFVLPLAVVLFFPLWLMWFFIRRARKNRKLPTQSS
jgi:adenine-specific DNA methylase